MSESYYPFDFFAAVERGDLKTVEAIYRDRGKLPLNVNLTYACGATFLLQLPLVTALKRGHYALARVLIDCGADLDAKCRKCGKTPREFLPRDFDTASGFDLVRDLLDKIKAGDAAGVKAFLETHPNAMLNENYIVGRESHPLPLVLAFRRGRLDIARMLIVHGAKLDVWCKKSDKYVREFMPAGFALAEAETDGSENIGQ